MNTNQTELERVDQEFDERFSESRYATRIKAFLHTQIKEAEERGREKAKIEIISDLIISGKNPSYYPSYLPTNEEFKKAYERFMKPDDYTGGLSPLPIDKSK